MPRSRGSGGGGRAPSRPMAPAKAPAPAPQRQQTRPASTAAAPPQQQARPGQASGGSGLFGQMASTAAGVAVGSSIGHAVGGWFGGSSEAAPQQQQEAQAYNTNAQANTSYGAQPCDVDARQFTKCMDDHQGNMQICSWYLDQLKACQQAASLY